MHTLQMTLAGLALLGLFVGAAKLMTRPSWTIDRATSIFIPLWLAIAVGNMVIGMVTAGVPFMTELLVLVVVFGVPAAAAWFIRQRQLA
jgi:hypothetical protein